MSECHICNGEGIIHCIRGTYEVCPHCGGIKNFNNSDKCTVCEGKGVITIQSKRGVEEIDCPHCSS